MCDRCLTGILHCLEPGARIIHVFREIAGLSYLEIAEVVGKDLQNEAKLANFMKD